MVRRHPDQEDPMTVEVLNPAGLPQPDVYRQVSIATGSRLVFLAGQVARDAGGGPVGAGDLAAQVEQALRNVVTAVEAAGGTFADVAKLTIYAVDWNEAKMPALGEGVMRVAGELGIDPLKPVTLIGVSSLGEPDLLVEIEAIAVLD
jgi:enamine deaminase RidA (YjgF/YER057c/UK114 family)